MDNVNFLPVLDQDGRILISNLKHLPNKKVLIYNDRLELCDKH